MGRYGMLSCRGGGGVDGFVKVVQLPKMIIEYQQAKQRAA